LLEWGKEALGQQPKAVEPSKISKFHRLGFLFYIFVIFYPFFLYFSLSLHIFILKIFYGVFLYQLEIYQLIIFFKKLQHHVGFSQTTDIVVGQQNVGFNQITDIVVDNVASVV